MSRRSTESMLRDLSRDLTPVRRIPALRSAVFAALGVWAVVVAAHWALGGALPRFGAEGRWGDPSFVGVLAGLGLGAGAALVAALAGSVPGRERTARAGGALAAGGFAVAVGACLLAWNSPEPNATLFAAASCVAQAAAIGLAPALLACAFLARAFERRPLVGAPIAMLGAGALGAATVHASCACHGTVHVLVGHALAPVVAAALLALPLAWLVGRGSSGRPRSLHESSGSAPPRGR